MRSSTSMAGSGSRATRRRRRRTVDPTSRTCIDAAWHPGRCWVTQVDLSLLHGPLSSAAHREADHLLTLLISEPLFSDHSSRTVETNSQSALPPRGRSASRASPREIRDPVSLVVLDLDNSRLEPDFEHAASARKMAAATDHVDLRDHMHRAEVKRSLSTSNLSVSPSVISRRRTPLTTVSSGATTRAFARWVPRVCCRTCTWPAHRGLPRRSAPSSSPTSSRSSLLSTRSLPARRWTSRFEALAASCEPPPRVALPLHPRAC